MVSDFLAISGCFILKINYYFLCFQLRAQNQVLKKGVVDEQANSAALKDDATKILGVTTKIQHNQINKTGDK